MMQSLLLFSKNKELPRAYLLSVSYVALFPVLYCVMRTAHEPVVPVGSRRYHTVSRRESSRSGPGGRRVSTGPWGVGCDRDTTAPVCGLGTKALSVGSRHGVATAVVGCRGGAREGCRLDVGDLGRQRVLSRRNVRCCPLDGVGSYLACIKQSVN